MIEAKKCDVFRFSDTEKRDEKKKGGTMFASYEKSDDSGGRESVREGC